MLDRIQLKREAKDLTRSARVSAYLFTLLYLAIIYVLTGIDTYTSGSIVDFMALNFPELEAPAFLQHDIPASVVMFVSVMVMLLSAVLNAGYTLYHLGVRRGETMTYTTLFDGFSFVGKVILLELMVKLSIFLWSMLFFFPGIIAAYRLRYAVYNLCENPEMGVMEAMNMSTAQTRGFKMDLFVLDITFFGWRMLSLLTMGVLDIWVTPYIVQTNVGYFQQIKKIKGIGWFPPRQEDDGQFHGQDPFGPNA
jgi:uncharacterized membrane protein